MSGREIDDANVELLTVQETARALRLSRTKVYQLMDDGRLAYVKLDKSRRVPRTAVTRLIQQCTVADSTPADK